MKRIVITIILTLVFTAITPHSRAQTAFKGAGVIESTSGGFKFPDGTVQVSAAETVMSLPPTAVIHIMEQNGLQILFSANGSFDPEDELLGFEWNFGDLSPVAETIEVQHTYPFPGTFLVTLKVDDPSGLIGMASTRISVKEANSPPVADIDSDPGFGICGDVVMLDGGGSADPDADPITFQWSFVIMPAGGQAEFNNNTLVNPSFTPDVAGEWVVRLIVSDGELDSAPVEAVWVCSNP